MAGLTAKLKADAVLNTDRKKRSALGNRTNANVFGNKLGESTVEDVEKSDSEEKATRRITRTELEQIENVPPVNKVQTCATTKTTDIHTAEEWSGFKPASLI